MSQRSLYGAEGRRFEVMPGDVWQAGSHTFVCSDLLLDHPELLREIEELQPTLLYCDPPWGQAAASSFARKAGTDSVDWRLLYAKVIEHGRGLPCYIESGVRQADEIQQMMKATDQAVVLSRDILYAKFSPAVLHYVGPDLPRAQFEGAIPDDLMTPGIVLAAYEAGVVFDPMAGRGLTALWADRMGWISLNNELNPFRVSAALARLEKRGRPVRLLLGRPETGA